MKFRLLFIAGTPIDLTIEISAKNNKNGSSEEEFFIVLAGNAESSKTNH